MKAVNEEVEDVRRQFNEIASPLASAQHILPEIQQQSVEPIVDMAASDAIAVEEPLNGHLHEEASSEKRLHE
jgi:hypothetical protein